MTSALAPFRIGRGSSMSALSRKGVTMCSLSSRWRCATIGPWSQRLARAARELYESGGDVDEVDALYESRGNVHEQDFQYRHARKDHRVTHVRTVGGRKLVRVGED